MVTARLMWCQLLIQDNPGPIRTRKTVKGFGPGGGAEVYLVGVNQSDKEEK